MSEHILDPLARLEATIEERKAEGDASKSHTAKLLGAGPLKCAQKFGEEAVEAVIALCAQDKNEAVSEAADAIYHLMVALSARGLSLTDVANELARREGRSGVVERASRPNAQGVTIERLGGEDDLTACLSIRRQVFIDEQGAAAEIEFDGEDKRCLHYLMRVKGAPTATARFMLTPEGAKVQRVAVLPHARGMGLGKRLMLRIMADMAREHPGTPLVLGAQLRAAPFYEQLGFRLTGEEYEEAGVPHGRMVLALGEN